MQFKESKPRKALNKAYLKIKPNRSGIEAFKSNLIRVLESANDTESEEFHKNLISDFLKRTWYEPAHFINTKGYNDLVIHNGTSATASVGVIIEAKKPTNKAEMVSREKFNVKSFQELVLYYLRERISGKNLEVRHLVITNIYEWFIFDAAVFDKLFAQNKQLVKQFQDFEQGRLASKQTDFFYREIAAPHIENISREVEFTYFDIRDYEKPLRNHDKQDDNALIALYKLLSPEHLLKLPFANDSNSLDKKFYSELLHIIGLAETKEGGKKLIGRKADGQRNSGSILEDAIIQLDSLDKISRLDKPSQFGALHGERLFNVALELSITWVNRILFLKLLEAQLIAYHKGDKSYAFLNSSFIKEYDDLNTLFFQVLARRSDQRNDDVKSTYQNVPYLNSSLFEPTDLEHATILISNLKDEKTIPIIPATVLTDLIGKKRTGSLGTLQYLLEFLDAYDFSSEGAEDIQEDNKTLINASVLGLIFEKINGYKDGSFFTPGFITMYMCRETIRRAVVQKFNEVKGWNCENIESLYDKIDDRAEANSIVNSLRICDPAVGSGHFLVSALNEMIALKHDLRILGDRNGNRLKEYAFEVVNDELIVTDEDGRLFEYHPSSRESQRVQEALFHEKQTIIENCLFGVDINPNSVKICRLRLWIELLKNAYYRNATELETLPNIDINIKCGNSLVSRFAIDADLGQALKKSKWTIDSYRLAVDTYRNAKSKEEKREMEKLIADIKSDFRSEISLNDKTYVKYRKLSGDLFTLTNQTQLFEQSKQERANWNKQVEKLTAETRKLEAEIDEIKNNKIFENAFEWRFEFPEVLDHDGNFVGFDVVIGNPPYIRSEQFNEFKNHFSTSDQYETTYLKYDLYVLFIERAVRILRSNGSFSFIFPNAFLNIPYASLIRKFVLEKTSITTLVDFNDNLVFDSALVHTCILGLEKKCAKRNHDFQYYFVESPIEHFALATPISINQQTFGSHSNHEFKPNIKTNYKTIIEKIENNSKLGDYFYVSKGIVAYSKSDDRKKGDFLSKFKVDDRSKPYLEGKDVKKYSIEFAGNYLAYDPSVMSRPTFPELHENPKILVRAMSNELQATVDNLGYYIDQKLIIASNRKVIEPFLSPSKKPKRKPLDEQIDISNEAIVGILNSTTYRFYYNEVLKKGISVLPQDIRQLPIKPLALGENEIEKLVNILLSKDSTIEEKLVLSQIDQLVYQLYNLTEEEIAIVEAAVK